MEKNTKNEAPAIPENFVTIAQLKERWTLKQQQKQKQQQLQLEPNIYLQSNTPNQPVRQTDTPNQQVLKIDANRKVERTGDNSRKAGCQAMKKNERAHVPGSNEGRVVARERHVPGDVIVESKVLTVELEELSLSETRRGGGNVMVVNRGGSRGRIRGREEFRRGGRQWKGRMVWVKKGTGEVSGERLGKCTSSSGLSIEHELVSKK